MNTMIVAPVILEIIDMQYQIIWIIHNIYDKDQIIKSRDIINIGELSIETIDQALVQKNVHVIFHCETQRLSFPHQNIISYSVIFDCVSSAISKIISSKFDTVVSHVPINYELDKENSLFHNKKCRALRENGCGDTLGSCVPSTFKYTILVVGPVNEVSNQLFAISLFNEFITTQQRHDVHLLLLNGSPTTLNGHVKYDATGGDDSTSTMLNDMAIKHNVTDMHYLDRVLETISHHANISLIDLDENYLDYFLLSHVLLITSTFEITPLIIPIAMACQLPIVSSNVGGIHEMISHGVNGFLYEIDNPRGGTNHNTQRDKDLFEKPLEYLNILCSMRKNIINKEICDRIKDEELSTYHKRFSIDVMIGQYRYVLHDVAKMTILLDMDGVVVDWDKGFMQIWGNRSPVDRTISYHMEDCVPIEYRQEAIQIFHAKGFFENLPPMQDSIDVVKELSRMGYKVFFCTTPVMTSEYCMQEKINWVKLHFGNAWCKRIILTTDKVSAVFLSFCCI